MNGQLPTVIICGATGVGKTDFSLALAQKVDAEIINADMGQFYAPLTIGTAKPDWRALPSVHHAFDIIDEPKDFTSASYRKLVSSMIHEVHSRGRIPLIVGGSTLYISSLFFPPTSKAASTVLKTTLPDDQLWNYLYRIDPDRAKHIHPRDIYRIKRALTIWETTHKKPSAFRVQFDPVAQPFILIILLRDRDDLYTRINHRVRSMIDQGWIEEVKALISGPWVPFLLKKKLIGYDEIIRYLEMPKEGRNRGVLIDAIAQKTRNYAKRQTTFWRMLEKKLFPYIKKYPHSSLYTINLTTDTIEYYVETIASSVR